MMKLLLLLLALPLLLHASRSGVSARQLQQTSNTFTQPGCTPVANSVLVTNPDYYDFLIELNQTGVLNYLEHAEAPITVFAFTNAAQEEAVASYNHTIQQADTDPLIASAVYDGKLYSIVREAVPELSDFQDGEELTTLLGPQFQPGAPGDDNLTVRTATINGTETVSLVSYGTIVTIITPAQYACNLIIYGVSGVVVPTGFVDFNDTLYHYLEVILQPGGAELPAQLVLDAVSAGQISVVAAAFDEAVQLGYAAQLVPILEQAVRIPGGVVTLASIANQMIVQSGCGTLQPLIHQLYPSVYSIPESLGLTPADLTTVPAMDPRLASCAINGV